MAQSTMMADDSILPNVLLRLQSEWDGVSRASLDEANSASSMAASIHPSLISLDVGLPQCDGPNFCQMLKPNLAAALDSYSQPSLASNVNDLNLEMVGYFPTTIPRRENASTYSSY
jgi:hypothetical protein